MISIITINFNNKEGLRNTIESVIGQSYTQIEYIVIDGNSQDGSKELIDQYNDQISYAVSESDNGVYEAMNKGIRVSNGEYLLFLNSGDTLNNSGVIESVAKELTDHDIYYGNLIFTRDGEKKEKIYPEKLDFGYFLKTSIGHPASFIKRSLFESVFYYNEDLKIVSDWEFFICAICKHNATYKHLDLLISNFESNGMSNLPENKEVMNKETQQVLQNHFPYFVENYIKAEKSIGLLESNRFKMLAELEHSTIAKKLNSALLRLFLRLFRNKSLKDL